MLTAGLARCNRRLVLPEEGKLSGRGIGVLTMARKMLAPFGPVRWIRPGSGWFTPRMLRAVGEQDLRLVLGSVVAMHTGALSDRRIASMLAGEVRPGSIVVLHEGTADRRGVVAATDLLLTRLGRRGFTAVTVSELATPRP